MGTHAPAGDARAGAAGGQAIRILIDILHPAHVHFFRNFHAEMRARGHELFITARAKEISVELLEQTGLPFQRISNQRSGAVGLAREMLERSYRLMGIVRRFKPDVLLGIMGPSIALVGKVTRVPAVIFYDTEFARQTNWFAYPLAHSVCTPDCYQEKVRGRHVTYPGYHELAYLHPARFTPDPTRLPAFGVHEGERYFLLRFVSWQASHDKGEVGLTDDRKRRLVALLAPHGRVLISSEGRVPPDLEPLVLRGPLVDVHHLVAYAQMIVGESATMASEAAVLGVPAVFIATTSRGYIDDQERRYGHVRHFTEDQFEQAMDSIGGLLTRGPREVGSAARTRLLADKIDVTAWMIDYIEREFG